LTAIKILATIDYRVRFWFSELYVFRLSHTGGNNHSIVGFVEMAILVGIDEAGFGPILGPLVVSSSSFLLPGHLLTSDLWQILGRSVAKKLKQLSGRLLITDSKKAHSKSLGIKHLQRTVLAALRCLGQKPATLTELIDLLCPDCLERLSNYPWYQDAKSQKILVDEADRTIASRVLADDLSSNDIELLGLKSCCLDVAYYNKMMSGVKNKANVLFTATSQLIKNAFDSFEGHDFHIIVDRQGGRVHYRKNLQRMFPEMELRIISETQQTSSYELQTCSRTVRLYFIVDADEHFLPVSLASMVSKYLRELLVYNINRYFISHCADLRPTAGYWKDGLRFIEDLRMNSPHIQFNSNQLIRCR
jgi:ribonuclease HII